MAPVGAETDGIEGEGRCAGHRVASIAAPWRLPARCPAPSRHATARVARDSSRSEEHTSELQSLMRISYAVFCLKKKIYALKVQTDNRRTHSISIRNI